jgi:hypothetical protein
VRVLIAVAGLVLGVATGVAVVAVHTWWWGLGLGLATTAALLAVLPRGWGRLPFGLAWVGVVWMAMTPRPEGDYAIGADAQGYLVIGAGLVLIVVAIVTSAFPGRTSPRAGPARAGVGEDSEPT